MSMLDQVATARDDAFAARVYMRAFDNAYYIATFEPNTAPDNAARLAYAQRVFRGDENPKILSMHVIAASPDIATAIDASPALLGSNVTDAQIDSALATLWTGRAKAFA